MSESATNHIEWFMERYRALERGQVSESTFDTRKRQLRTFKEWFAGDLAEVTGDDIEQYIIELSSEGYGSKTIAGRRWALSKFYRQMADKGRTDENPVETVAWEDIGVASGQTRKAEMSEKNEDIYTLSQEEVKQLAEHVPEPKVRNELLIKLLASTGMRAHEVANVKLDHMNWDERTIQVVDEKTGDSRTVVYPQSLDFLMHQWVRDGHRDVYSSATDSPYLFVTRKSPKIDNNRVNEVVRQAAENADLQEVMYEDAAGKQRYRITSHTLRHTFAVHALSPDTGQGSMDLRYLQECLGHDDITTTQEYLQYVETDAIDDMRKHGPSF